MGTTVLTRVGFLHLATATVGYVLRPVADAKHRHLANELAQIHLKGFRVVNRIGRTGKNHANHRLIANRELVVGQNFAKRVEFAHATTNQLSGLRAEIQDDNFLLHEF